MCLTSFGENNTRCGICTRDCRKWKNDRFYQKQIIVFCAGAFAFAEINEDGENEKLIKRLAKISLRRGMTGRTIYH
jgi:hypothetical protein